MKKSLKKTLSVLLVVMLMMGTMAIAANAAPIYIPQPDLFSSLFKVFGNPFSFSSIFSRISDFFASLSFVASIITFLVQIFG